VAFLRRRHPAWEPPVVLTSAVSGRGVDELWQAVERHRSVLGADGSLASRRAEQARAAMWNEVRGQLLGALLADSSVRELAASFEAAVSNGTAVPAAAATELVARSMAADQRPRPSTTSSSAPATASNPHDVA
jgi:LAO/AO transport system kinase